MKENKWSLSTVDGCKRWLAILLAVILLFSFFARLIQSDGATVKVEKIVLDIHGATLDTELYYPVGTSDNDKLPAVVTTHGGGVSKGVSKGYAEELARRGFVVINVDSYGSGMSEQPMIDDGGQGINGFDKDLAASGMLDAVNYLRSISFVDDTRIGVTGHSNGSRRVAITTLLDAGNYTLNDILINIMYDNFDEEFTLEELANDADEMAEERLNDDQLAHYYSLKAAAEEKYNTRVKSLCLIGGDGNTVGDLKTVTVAGHEVQRNCQANIMWLEGRWDVLNDYQKVLVNGKMDYFHTDEPIMEDRWYAIDDVNESCEIFGSLLETSAIDTPALQEAIDNREARIFVYNNETHSKNYFSKDTTGDMVKFFEQTLSYNNGELSDPNTQPIDSRNIIWMWRELCNTVAMLAMFASLIVFAALLMKTKLFAPCITHASRELNAPFNKKRYYIIGLVTVVLSYICIYMTNGVSIPKMQSILPISQTFPFYFNWKVTIYFVVLLAVASAILLGISVAFNKKDTGKTGLSVLNLKTPVVDFLRALLLSILVIAFAYFLLTLIMYLFGQDFRFWTAAFTEMKVEYWGYIWKFFIFLFPCFILISMSTNYCIRTDIPEWKDTLITVILNSAGIWLCCLVNYICLLATGEMYSDFISCYGFLIVVPITVVITRKLYLLTNRVWLGAAVNSLVIAWHMASTVGVSAGYYGPQAISAFFGF